MERGNDSDDDTDMTEDLFDKSTMADGLEKTIVNVAGALPRGVKKLGDKMGWNARSTAVGGTYEQLGTRAVPDDEAPEPAGASYVSMGTAGYGAMAALYFSVSMVFLISGGTMANPANGFATNTSFSLFYEHAAYTASGQQFPLTYVATARTTAIYFVGYLMTMLFVLFGLYFTAFGRMMWAVCISPDRAVAMNDVMHAEAQSRGLSGVLFAGRIVFYMMIGVIYQVLTVTQSLHGVLMGCLVLTFFCNTSFVVEYVSEMLHAMFKVYERLRMYVTKKDSNTGVVLTKKTRDAVASNASVAGSMDLERLIVTEIAAQISKHNNIMMRGSAAANSAVGTLLISLMGVLTFLVITIAYGYDQIGANRPWCVTVLTIVFFIDIFIQLFKVCAGVWHNFRAAAHNTKSVSGSWFEHSWYVTYGENVWFCIMVTVSVWFIVKEAVLRSASSLGPAA